MVRAIEGITPVRTEFPMAISFISLADLADSLVAFVNAEEATEVADADILSVTCEG